MIKITLEDDGESVESKLEVNGTSTAELAALYTHVGRKIMEPIKKGKVTKADLQIALNNANLELTHKDEVIEDLQKDLRKAKLVYSALLAYTVDK